MQFAVIMSHRYPFSHPLSRLQICVSSAFVQILEFGHGQGIVHSYVQCNSVYFLLFSASAGFGRRSRAALVLGALIMWLQLLQFCGQLLGFVMRFLIVLRLRFHNDPRCHVACRLRQNDNSNNNNGNAQEFVRMNLMNYDRCLITANKDRQSIASQDL